MTGAMFAGASPEETERHVERWAADVAAKAESYKAMQAQVALVSATELSADGAVQVTVDSSGIVTDLVITDRAAQLRPAELAARIMDTMRRAQSQLAGQVRDVMRRMVGDDEDTVGAVVASYQRRFPEPPEPQSTGYGDDLRIGAVEDDEESASPPQQRPRPPRHPDTPDDDWGGPILCR